MGRGEGAHDFAFLSELAQLEDVIVIIGEEYPETRGLLETLLTAQEFERMIQESAERTKAREGREELLRAQKEGDE